MSDTLYRINPEWLTYYRRTDQEMIAEINDEFGVHGEGINSMVPLVPAKIDYEAATDALCDDLAGGPSGASDAEVAARIVNSALGIEDSDG